MWVCVCVRRGNSGTNMRCALQNYPPTTTSHSYRSLLCTFTVKGSKFPHRHLILSYLQRNLPFFSTGESAHNGPLPRAHPPSPNHNPYRAHSLVQGQGTMQIHPPRRRYTPPKGTQPSRQPRRLPWLRPAERGRAALSPGKRARRWRRSFISNSQAAARAGPQRAQGQS